MTAVRPRRTGSVVVVGATAVVLLFLVGPIFVAASSSFSESAYISFPPEGFSTQWYSSYLQNPLWRDAAVNTVAIGLMCAVMATVVGTLAAVGLQQIRSRMLRDAVFALFLMPLVVPFMVLAMALYPIFADLGLLSSRLGVALAQATVSVPYVLMSVTAAMRRRDLELVKAARTLGASPLTAFLTVRIRLLLPGIVGGAVLSFMTTFDDIIMPLFMGGTTGGTLPRVMVDSLYALSDPTVMAVSASISLVGLVMLALFIVAERTRTPRVSDESAAA